MSDDLSRADLEGMTPDEVLAAYEAGRLDAVSRGGDPGAVSNHRFGCPRPGNYVVEEDPATRKASEGNLLACSDHACSGSGRVRTYRNH